MKSMATNSEYRANLLLSFQPLASSHAATFRVGANMVTGITFSADLALTRSHF
jgi:hypothetical protein